jgi:hypothetical protein
MNREEFDNIMSGLDQNDALIVATLFGVVKVAHPVIIVEAWRHAIITGLYKKVNEDFEEAALFHLDTGILLSLN